MTVTIEMPEAELNQIKRLTNLPDNAQAVVQAAKEFLRVSRLRQKAVSDEMDFANNGEDLERPESAEVDVSQPAAQARSYEQVMATIRERQRQRGYRPPTREEVDAYLQAERDSWGD